MTAIQHNRSVLGFLGQPSQQRAQFDVQNPIERVRGVQAEIGRDDELARPWFAPIGAGLPDQRVATVARKVDHCGVFIRAASDQALIPIQYARSSGIAVAARVDLETAFVQYSTHQVDVVVNALQTKRLRTD
jgi:hypothetical protein